MHYYCSLQESFLNSWDVWNYYFISNIIDWLWWRSEKCSWLYKICNKTKNWTVTIELDVYNPSSTVFKGSNKNFGTSFTKNSELTTTKKLWLVNNHGKSLSKWKDMHAILIKHSKLRGKLEIEHAKSKAS